MDTSNENGKKKAGTSYYYWVNKKTGTGTVTGNKKKTGTGLLELLKNEYNRFWYNKQELAFILMTCSLI